MQGGNKVESIKGKVAIIGTAMTPFGGLYDKSVEDLAQEVFINCVKSVDKGIDPKEIKAGWIGSIGMDLLIPGGMSGSWLTTQMGNADIPITRVCDGCITGGDTLRQAVIGIATGLYDVVIALGAEKMTEKTASDLLMPLGGELLGFNPYWIWGMTAPATQALYATRQMYEFGYTMEMFARVAVKNHRNGKRCPYAYYRHEVTIEEVLKSPLVCWPLHLLDCCPQTDGAAAAILCRADLAKKYTDKPVYVLGSNVGVDYALYWDKANFIELPATIRAARGAFEMAGVKPAEVDLAETHDCFTNTELLNIEDIGFCKKGGAGPLVMEGEFDIGGRIPVGPSGGLKTHGHPIGATGLFQICECFWQLREEAGERQVKIDRGIALQHNVGGAGFADSCVTILSRSA